MNDEVIKNGIVGQIESDEVFIYCNEQDPNRGKFLFKCCEGCIHTPPLDT